jgi:signal transduction histidine kinase
MGVFRARPADTALDPDRSSLQPYVRYVRVAAALAFAGAVLRYSVASDLRAAESRLVRATQDNERQLAMLAHELRNPLTPLRNGIEIFRQISSSNPALARTTEMMARQIGQLVQLVDELVGTEPSSAVAGESLGTQIGLCSNAGVSGIFTLANSSRGR